jgi:uncharacterized protein YndB with AHSA1/START domain
MSRIPFVTNGVMQFHHSRGTYQEEITIMAKVEKATTVNATVENVFDYLAQPTNLPEIWPSLVENTDVQPLPNGGNSYHWVYKMAGMHFKGRSEDIEHVANERIVTKTTGGIQSTITWTLQPEVGGTKVTFDAEYTVPIPLLGRLAEAFIVRQNEHEAELLLANLKARMEA